VARRPSVASREKDPAAAGMRRFFSPEQRVEKKISALVVVVVVVARLSVYRILGVPAALQSDSR